MNTASKFNFRLLLFALGGGTAASLVINLLFGVLYGVWPNGVLVALCFLIFSSFVLAACVLSEFIEPRIATQAENSKVKSLKIASFFIAVAGVTLVSGLFQFLYEIAVPTQSTAAEDFIFVVDDSDSMNWNDPLNERFSAMMDIVDDLDEHNNIGLVEFCDIITNKINLMRATPENKKLFKEQLSGISDGGTNIEGALYEALDVADNSGKRYSMVILVSDGESDVNVSGVAKAFTDSGVVINTVGLSVGFGERSLLQNIANSTGGKYYSVQDASELLGVMTEISNIENSNNLLDSRSGSKRSSALHMIMRVIFVAVLNAAVGFALKFVFDNINVRQVIISAATGIVGGLILEIGLYNFLNQAVLRLIAFLIMALVPTMFVVKIGFDPLPQSPRRNYMPPTYGRDPYSDSIGKEIKR
jgi:Ca-activated chloride channel family protein